MSQLMCCPFCGLLQDEPAGVKECARCGGGLEYQSQLPDKRAYLQVQLELDQVAAPANLNVERYLLLTLRTPQQVPAEEAMTRESARPPFNFTAVLDISGSMRGEKISQAKQAVEQAVHYLHPGDAFSLVTFASDVNVPFVTDRVDKTTHAALKQALQPVHASGQTALCSGLEIGIAKAQGQKRDNNLLILLSDGQANVGETDLEKVGVRAFEARQQGSLVSTIGVGIDYNEALLAEIAIQGGGRFYHIENANQIPAYLAGELGEVAYLAAKDVQINLTLPNGATLIPLSAAYPVRQVDGQAIVSVGELPCDMELEIPLRLALLAQPAGSKLSIEGTLSFRSPAGHALECSVNRVTVRFIDQAGFQPRQGVVTPVAERVFAQMRSSSVLGVARLRALRPNEAEQKAETILASLNSYADLLGKDRAENEIHAIRQEFDSMAASPSSSKQAVANAYRSVRSSKDFHKR